MSRNLRQRIQALERVIVSREPVIEDWMLRLAEVTGISTDHPQGACATVRVLLNISLPKEQELLKNAMMRRRTSSYTEAEMAAIGQFKFLNELTKNL